MEGQWTIFSESSRVWPLRSVWDVGALNVLYRTQQAFLVLAAGGAPA